MEKLKSFVAPTASFSSEEVGKNIEGSRRNFEKAADAVATLVQEAHGLTVPEETTRQWRTLMSAIRIVDDRIDHTQNSEKRRILVETIKASLQGEKVDFSDDPALAHAMQQVEELASAIGEEKKHFLNTMFSLILRVTEEIRLEPDPQELVRLTMLEGQMTIKLFLPFLPKEFKNGEPYKKLVYTLSRFGRGANSFDTFVDLPSDYANNAVMVKPTVVNRLLFLSAALTNGVKTVRNTGIPAELVSKFVWGTAATLQNGSEKGRLVKELTREKSNNEESLL